MRKIQAADINGLIKISVYEGAQAATLQQAMNMQEKINKDYGAGNSINWEIADNTTNNIIANCGYYRGLANGAGELGCILLPHY